MITVLGKALENNFPILDAKYLSEINENDFAKILEGEDTTLIITSAMGQVVKMELSSIPSRSRTAKGVILMRFSGKEDRIVSATSV